MADFDQDNINKRSPDFAAANKIVIDYKDTEVLKKFLTPEGKILPGRRTGLSLKNQRKMTTAIKRARVLGLLPFTTPDF